MLKHGRFLMKDKTTGDEKHLMEYNLNILNNSQPGEIQVSILCKAAQRPRAVAG